MSITFGKVMDATITPQDCITVTNQDGDTQLYVAEVLFNRTKVILCREAPITDKWLNEIRPYLKKKYPSIDNW